MHHRTQQQIMQNWKGDLGAPVVSVCCITFNHESYIAETIDGFLIQETDFPFEILIRDDCSTDKTADIINHYVSQYPDIIKPIFEKENQYSQGIYPLPVVMKKAVGKYIALCEGDDYWIASSKLQKQVDFLEENDAYSICYHSRLFVDHNSRVIEPPYLDPDVDYSKEELISGIAIPMNDTAVFRNILDDSFYDLKALLWDALLLHCIGFYGKSKFLETIVNGSAYRITEGGLWNKRSRSERVNVWLETKRVIRNNILEKMPGDKQLLEMHDGGYAVFFNSLLAGFILEKNMKEYFFVLKALRDNRDLNRLYILHYHIKFLLNRSSMKLLQILNIKKTESIS